MRSISLVAALGALVSAAQAHDFWVEPRTFTPEPEALLAVRLMVGDHGQGDPVVRDPGRLERFVLVDGEGQREVPGRDGADPAGIVRLGPAGTAVLGFRSRPAYIELDAPSFTSYLAEEGLEAVAAWREANGEASAPGRERYSRCAKAIVDSGGPARGHDRVLGLPLELVPALHPRRVADAPLGLTLLWQGEPLEGVLVEAIPLDRPGDALGDDPSPRVARTDGDGRVELRLAEPGRWLVAAVHMSRVADDPRADWESHWASLTLRVTGPG